MQITPLDGSAATVFTEGVSDLGGACLCEKTGRLITWQRGAEEMFLWDVESGQQLAALPHGAQLIGAAVHPQFGAIASWCNDSLARVWDARNGTLLASFPHSDLVNGCIWTGQGFECVTFDSLNDITAWHPPTECPSIELWTGTKLDDNGRYHVLPAKEWQKLRAQP